MVLEQTQRTQTSPRDNWQPNLSVVPQYSIAAAIMSHKRQSGLGTPRLRPECSCTVRCAGQAKLRCRVAQRQNDMLNQVIKRDIELLGAAHDILTMDGSREGFVFHLLANACHIYIVKALAWAHQR